ncbi:MAG: hypothetical protein KAI28_12710 [Sphingomonadales bacterium]|nr:hypothetical protein [Sphingomonadales bacterium]
MNHVKALSILAVCGSVLSAPVALADENEAPAEIAQKITGQMDYIFGQVAKRENDTIDSKGVHELYRMLFEVTGMCMYMAKQNGLENDIAGFSQAFDDRAKLKAQSDGHAYDEEHISKIKKYKIEDYEKSFAANEEQRKFVPYLCNEYKIRAFDKGYTLSVLADDGALWRDDVQAFAFSAIADDTSAKLKADVEQLMDDWRTKSNPLTAHLAPKSLALDRFIFLSLCTQIAKRTGYQAGFTYFSPLFNWSAEDYFAEGASGSQSVAELQGFTLESLDVYLNNSPKDANDLSFACSYFQGRFKTNNPLF